MAETELKLLIDAATADALATRLAGMDGLAGAPRTAQLRTTYYDTPDHALKDAGIALRLRKDGQRWVQTVKADARRHGGLQRATEDEVAAPGGTLDLSRITDPALGERVRAIIGDASLSPVCRTDLTRVSTEVALPSGTAEVAIDTVDVSAGDAEARFYELEVELIAGDTASVFDIAKALLPEGGLAFSRMSKAERGYRLAAGAPIAPSPTPQKAGKTATAPGQTTDAAAQAVLRTTFAQIAHNAEVVLTSDDPEGPHQLRVGLRRFRSAASAFRKAIGTDELRRLGDEAKWLGRQAAPLRDLDVLTGEILADAQADRPDEPGFAPLAKALATDRKAARSTLRDALRGARAQAFLLDLCRFIEARGWRDISPKALDTPVEKRARKALSKRWKRTKKCAEGLEDLDIDARHTLRKELKKLRYTVEIFRPVLSQAKAKPFLKRLKGLQAVFGDLNDAAMADAILSAPDAPARNSPRAQRVVGLTLATLEARADRDWPAATDRWHDLQATDRPW